MQLNTHRKRPFGSIFGRSLIQIFMISWTLMLLLPIFWLLYSSFKTSSAIRANTFAFPKVIAWENYDFSSLSDVGLTIGIYYRNSIIISVVSLFILIFISLIASYSIAKLKFPGKNVIMIIFIALLGIPVHAILIPLYYQMLSYGLLDKYLGVILPYIALFSPFTILLLQAYFREFPNELIDAAKIDGCGNLRTFFSIVLPISKGAVSSVLIINFINIWNEFLFALVVMTNNNAKTLPVGLMGFQGTYAIEWGPLFATLVITIIPTIIIYFIFHRNIIQGITTGAIKG